MTAPHTPYMPARDDLPEAIFLARWKALNTQMPSFLASVIGHRASVRDCRVAASFVTWIGTNCGTSFIYEAKSRVNDYVFTEPAYLATWALVNRRERHVSSNVRAIEVILSPESLFLGRGATPYERAQKLSISLRDLDTVEAVVKWLASAHGDAFVTDCVEEYASIRAQARRDHALLAELN
jgi:hypothetical protein